MNEIEIMSNKVGKTQKNCDDMIKVAFQKVDEMNHKINMTGISELNGKINEINDEISSKFF